MMTVSPPTFSEAMLGVKKLTTMPSSLVITASVGNIAQPRGPLDVQQFCSVLYGFLPSRAGERDSVVQLLSREPRPVVLMEAPHRVEALARALAVLGERPVTVGRELTKQFEEVVTMACAALPAWLAAEPQRTRGEFALVLHGTPRPKAEDDGERVLRLLLKELPLKGAVKLAAEITGGSKNELYDMALKFKAGDSGG